MDAVNAPQSTAQYNTPTGQQEAATDETRQFRERVLERRAFAQTTIQDMDRLYRGWTENSLTKATPLTVTLNAEQIDALGREFSRLRTIAEGCEQAARDWEIIHGEPPFNGSAVRVQGGGLKR